MNINRKYCKYNIIATLMFGTLLLCMSLIGDAMNAKVLSLTIMLFYIVMVGLWIASYPRINFYLLFLICTYLFYFGRYFLILLNDEKYFGDLVGAYDITIMNKTAIFIALSISVMNLFFNVSLLSKAKNTRERIGRYSYSLKCAKIVAWTFFAVSFIFSIEVLLVNMNNTRLYGYAYALSTYYDGFRVERFFSNFLSVSFILLILLYKKSKMNIVIFVFLSIYILLYFASGSRLEAILLIMSLILVYEYEFKHLNKKVLIKLGILMLGLSFVVVAISSIRNTVQYLSSSDSITKEIMLNFKDDNFILELINECGFQINSIAVVIENCPKNVPFNYGITYLKGIGQLMPNLFWKQNPFMQESTDTIFSYYLNRGAWGIGSSYIAEAYYNFGYFSIFVMPIFGWLFAKYQIHFENRELNSNLLVKFIYLSIPTYALFYVRSDAVGFLKAFVYRSLAPCVLIILLSSFLRERKVK